jgi:hypothetical protein
MTWLAVTRRLADNKNRTEGVIDMDHRHVWKRSPQLEIVATRKPTSRRLARLGLAAVVTVFLPVLAACGGSSTAATTPTPSSGPSGMFNVVLNFTGAQSVAGSLTTPTVGATCAQYATSDLAWTIGLGPEVGNPVPIDGTNINFLISLPPTTFHGAGTYTGNVVSGIMVGLDTFAGSDSTLTINKDGSGNASFTNYIGTTSSVDESGTLTWTCSPVK